jgi:hypothetical protein
MDRLYPLMLSLLFVSLLASAQDGAKSADAPRATPHHIFAPYIHMTETNSNLPQVAAQSGIKSFTLAFIIAGEGCSPAWQGEKPVPLQDEKTFSAYINSLQRNGGNVIVSFGGYVGQELALACGDPAALQAAYQAVINKYKVRMLDFDVEAGAIKDPPSIERRSKALKGLADANPGLEISFTLPVQPTGMDDTGLSVLKSAVANSVPVSVVNIMAMDYGRSAPSGDMGANAVAAAKATVRQMQGMGLNAHLGITPMIGVNDTPGQTFTVADARALVQYAQSNQSVARLSMWSVGRDNGSCSRTVSPTCSGIAQKTWEFSHIFARF